MKPRRLLMAGFGLLGVLSAQGAGDSTAVKILQTMLRAVPQVRDLRFELRDCEREGTQTHRGDETVTLALHPLRLYAKIIAPKSGVEVLWDAGRFGGKALVHPRGFPFFTVKLDPYGSALWTGHHPLFDVQPGYIAAIVAAGLREGLYQVRNLGLDSLDGRPCDRIALIDSAFGEDTLPVEKPESVLDIAKSFQLSAFRILGENPGLKPLAEIPAGRRLLVPTAYAPRLEVCVDRATSLPVMESVSDGHGLFERYEYHFLELNPPLPSDAFSENNPEYHFR